MTSLRAHSRVCHLQYPPLHNAVSLQNPWTIPEARKLVHNAGGVLKCLSWGRHWLLEDDDVIFIAAGTNNIPPCDVPTIIRRAGKMIDDLHEMRPNARLIIPHIPRRCDDPDHRDIFRDKINKVNSFLEHKCKKNPSFHFWNTTFALKITKPMDCISSQLVSINMQGTLKQWSIAWISMVNRSLLENWPSRQTTWRTITVRVTKTFFSKILFWNVNGLGDKMGCLDLHTIITSHDILAFTETIKGTYFQQHFPGYQSFHFPRKLKHRNAKNILGECSF